MRTEISIQNLKSKFIDKVEELSEENIYTCYQCGKCSAGCPSIS
ncbi:4Fe-4S dicluster domain-containing protein, partial [bacterium]|nr:4Fe-4S dicluster domain-containing protein [bacterium]